jgi:hypothetical protein
MHTPHKERTFSTLPLDFPGNQILYQFINGVWHDLLSAFYYYYQMEDTQLGAARHDVADLRVFYFI